MKIKNLLPLMVVSAVAVLAGVFIHNSSSGNMTNRTTENGKVQQKQAVRPPVYCFLNGLPVNSLAAVFGDNAEKLLSEKIFSSTELLQLAGLPATTPVRVMERKYAGKVYSFPQLVGGVHVFASMIVLQTDAYGNVTFVNCTFSEEAEKLEIVHRDFPENLQKKLIGENKAASIVKVSDVIFDPALLQLEGKTVAAWCADVQEANDGVIRYLIDVKTEQVLFKYGLRMETGDSK